MVINQAKVLSRMKKLIKEGKRRFQLRKDRDYLIDLLELGLSENEAWNYILTNINIILLLMIQSHPIVKVVRHWCLKGQLMA